MLTQASGESWWYRVLAWPPVYDEHGYGDAQCGREGACHHRQLMNGVAAIAYTWPLLQPDAVAAFLTQAS